MVPTDPHKPLVDTALADEIALLGELMVAAALAGHPLSQAEIDAALGLSSPDPGGGGSARQD